MLKVINGEIKLRSPLTYLALDQRNGAAAGADTPYLQPDYRGGVVLVLGAEGKGLRPRVAASCDALVRIPLRGRIDSLNVGATAAVLLYGILQRRLDTTT